MNPEPNTSMTACTVIRLTGRLSLDTYRKRLGEIRSVIKGEPRMGVTLDLSDVDYLDSAGALFLIQAEAMADEYGIPLQIVNIPERQEALLHLIDKNAVSALPLIPDHRQITFCEQLGEAFVDIYRDFIDLITFCGEIITELFFLIIHPRSIRWHDVLFSMRKIGVDGLPITGLISFLMGLIVAFMTALQLRPFGASVFVAALVGFAMVRELGPMMTAIVVAGRSGSAFAAEIGSMKINEEIEALTTMGFNPVRFLVIPKVIAAIIVVPVLTLYADIFAIAGGLFVGITSLDLTLHAYIQKTIASLRLFDFASSYIKSIFFAIIITTVGCYRGFRVSSGAESVGNAATSAIVTSLFLIILFDSVFAVLFHYIRLK